MCVTAHWIDSNWKLQKRIISFAHVEDHTGETLSQELMDCFEEWGITDIQSITMDNAAANDVCAKRLKTKMIESKWNFLENGELLHVRCACHILNLIVGVGLTQLTSSISAIRNAVRYARSSPARSKRFNEMVEKQKIESKAKLCMDVCTRWNSTYLMLESALKFRSTFDRMKEDLYFRAHFNEGKVGPPNNNDWENAVTFVSFLKTFFDHTERLSGTSYATSSLCLTDICEVKSRLDLLSKSKNEVVVNMVTEMQLRFKKYWGEAKLINHVVFLGSLLDPRYKLGYVEHCLKFLFGDTVAAKVVGDVKSLFLRMFDVYNGDKNSGLSASSSPPMQVHDDEERAFIVSSYIQKKTINAGMKKSEVDQYLSDPEENPSNRQFDVLMWWNVNAHKYPVISKIAKHILAIPSSTVASESTFSTSGRILDPYRCSLLPKTVEVLVCLKNWITSSNDIVVVREFMDEYLTGNDELDTDIP